MTIPQQIEYMRDQKGIQFNIVKEEQAALFLRDHTYYFKIKAFEKNYSKYTSGPKKGKYFELEFAYLQELSTLDMYLREIILSMTLDIEHYLKVRLLKDLSENEYEDGYSIVQEFFSCQPKVPLSITEKARNSYCEGLVQKYSESFAAWNIVEVLSFGDLVNFCDLYYSKYPDRTINMGDFRIVKFLRNAAAHNNCLINNLSDNSGNGFRQNRHANTFLATVEGISGKTKAKKMGNRSVHDFVVMLCCFQNIVSSPGVRQRQIGKLKALIDHRFLLHREYFAENKLLTSNYDFIKKVIDKIAQECI